MGAVPTIPAPPFTDIPNAPGAPTPLAPRAAPQPGEDPSSVQTADDPDVSSASQDGPQWGLFDDSGAAVISAAVLDFEVLFESVISDYPIEQGGFESYNKVTRPFEGRVTFAKSGTAADRTDFLNAIAAAKTALTLYSLVMPEETYANVNVIHYDFPRTAEKGVNLLRVNVWVREVRETATQTFSNTKDPNSADAVNDGSVQPTPPTTAQAPPLSTGVQ